MQSNKKEVVWGIGILIIFFISFFGWYIYQENNYKSDYVPSVSTTNSYNSNSGTGTSSNSSYNSNQTNTSSSTSNTSPTNNSVDEDAVYIYMKTQYDILTNKGENYDIDYHDPLIANKAANEFGITPSQATDIYLRKDYDATFGN